MQQGNITSLYGINIHQWTSKIGDGAIVTHEGVLVNNEDYGNEIYYARATLPGESWTTADEVIF